MTNKNNKNLTLCATEQHAITRVLPYYLNSTQNINVNTLGNGLINDTYLVESIEHSFVLQRINQHVFPTPQYIAQNAELIHEHLAQKIALSQYPFESIGHILNTQNKTLTFINNECWRAIDYIDNTYTVNAIENATQAKQVAQAFATFTATLSDFDATQLKETIPNFHNIESRLSQFHQALAQASTSKLATADSLISFVSENKSFVSHVNEISSKLPLRVTHNDTKINNLLFCKKTHQPKAVIDLDTCMPGFLMNDVGDLIRSTCPSVDENETNLSQMEIRLDVFETIVQSYIQSFESKGISVIEKESLVTGTLLLPFMLATRFLTDYLNGNVYFHTDYDTQNLDRAANQFHLFTLFKEKQTILRKLVHQE